MNTTKSPSCTFVVNTRVGGASYFSGTPLFRRFPIQIECNKCVKQVGHPYGNDRWHIAIHGKSGRDGLEEDIGETQSKSDTQMQSHAAFGLLGREGDPDKRQDERGERHGNAFVILNLELLDVGETTLPLPVNVFAQLWAGQHLLLVLHNQEVGRLHKKGRIYAVSFGDALLHAVHLANHIILDRPFMHGCRIVGDGARREVGNQLFFLELVQREPITCFAVVLETFDVGYHPRIHFQLNVSCRIGLTGLVIFVFKIKAGHTPSGNDIRTQTKRHNSNDGSRNHVRTQHAFEAHARGEHGDDFRILRQFGSKEDDRDKHEQRTEQIGKVGDEVQVIVKDNGTPRRFVRHEAVHLLVEVEYDRNGDNQCDGKDIRAQELLDDIPIQPLQEFTGRQLYILPYLSVHFSHNLVDTRFTIIGFHVAKSPAMMCLRASPTSHK